MEPPKPDSAGMALVWKLLQDMADAGQHAQAPTYENGWGVAIKALVVVAAVGVLAVIGLCGVIFWIFRRWESGQAAGIKALSATKDNTKKEVTEILKSELGNARAANAADTIEIKRQYKQLARSINLVVLDLAIIGQKLKIPMRSSPTTHENKNPAEEGG